MLYTAYGKECKLEFKKVFGDEWGLRAEYKDERGEYNYIAEPTMFASNLVTTEATDAAYTNALDEINAAMEALFGGVDEPESGTDRILWLMDNRTKVVDNKLTL